MTLTMTIEHPRKTADWRTTLIESMLEHYHEARAEAYGGESTGARNTSRINAFDTKTWTHEYVELERCLDHLRYLAGHGRPMIAKNVSSSTAWWNLRERYLNAQTVRREVHTRRTHSGNRVPVELPRNMEVVSRQTVLNGKTSSMLVRVWDPGVDLRVVRVAVDWVAGEFKGTPAVYGENP